MATNTRTGHYHWLSSAGFCIETHVSAAQIDSLILCFEDDTPEWLMDWAVRLGCYKEVQ